MTRRADERNLPAVELPSKNQLKVAGDRIRKRVTGAALELDGEQSVADERLVMRWRSAHSGALTTTRIGLGVIVARVLDRTSQSGLVVQRLKRWESIVSKLVRDKSRLGEIEDIAGCRAVLETKDQVDMVWSQLTNAYRLDIERVRDYRERPHQGGYRALHLWCRRAGFKVEVQLRTERQQRWASMVEEFDSTLGTDIKHENGPEVLLRYFRELANYMAVLDDGLDEPDVDLSSYRSAAADVRAWLVEEVRQ